MEDFGLVSIITPCYNGERFIGQMIESIQRQTYLNWELLITDDCSTDNSVRIVEKYMISDSRIKLFCLAENSGAGICRNRSISEAKGRFISFCDCDDYWIDTKLETQVRFMVVNNHTVSHGNVEFINVNGNIVGVKKYRSVVSYKMMLIDCAVSLQTIMYNAEVLGKFYMPKLRKRQDWGLWILLLRKAGYSYGIGKVLARYRLVPNSISSNKMSLIKYNWRVYRQVVGFGKFKTFVYFFFLYLPYYFLRQLQIKIASHNYVKNVG